MENTSIEMRKYGAVLTGREFGQDVWNQISIELGRTSVTLDFKGVVSLGSSFADEIILPLANLNSGVVNVANTSPAVSNCLRGVAKDNQITLKLG